jgi:hypothetical protein
MALCSFVAKEQAGLNLIRFEKGGCLERTASFLFKQVSDAEVDFTGTALCWFERSRERLAGRLSIKLNGYSNAD